MAQVTLQAIVNFDQVNKLDKWIKETDGKKITIDTTSYSKAVKEAEKATQELLKTQKAQAQANEAAAKAEKAIASATTEQIKAKKELVRVEIEQERKRKTELQTDQQAIKNRRETIKLEREEAKAQTEATKTGKEHNETVKKQGLLYDILGRSVSSFLARMVAYRAVYAGIRAITNGFKEALETLKAVDDELVTVRKVTGFDAYQMANVEEQAYSVASKYGASAADYTSSVAAFARAGYKEVSTDLAELAEKTKIVGDTTADVAQQFLLSVDAAYKYQGNIEKLSAVLDGMNEIDNNFATSIEKIAEGMGIVAPVAAQMNVSVDELAAGIGTITAVTQRSGTEAARALRAIFLNIVGDTKTEIEEGVTWTTGEIAGLRDVIKLYAKDAYDAAQASGQVIDPMRAIAGLAQSVKDGVLSEAKLTEMVSDIGGKLRTSQLLAIVNNWDMYENMLQTYKSAYGSADKEIENAMDSWTRKTNVLKNTWTEFVKTGLNSNAIKSALDMLTNFIKTFGTLPEMMTKVAALVVGIKFPEIAKGFKNAATSAKSFFSELKSGKSTLQSVPGMIGAIITIITAAFTFADMYTKKMRQQTRELVEEQYKQSEAATTSAKNTLDLYMQMDIAADSANNFTKEAKDLATALGTDIPEGAKAAIDSLSALTAAELKSAADSANSSYISAQKEYMREISGQGDSNTYWGNLYNVAGAREYWGQGIPERLKGSIEGVLRSAPTFTNDVTGQTLLDTKTIENAIKVREAFTEIIALRDEYIRQTGDESVIDAQYFKLIEKYLSETASKYDELNEKKDAAVNAEAMEIFQRVASKATVQTKEDFDELISRFRGARELTPELRDALIALANEYYGFNKAVEETTDAVEENTDAVEKETDSLRANQKALDENATASERAAAAKKDAESATHKYIDALITSTGEITAEGKAAFIASSYLADLANAELQARKEAAQANYAALRAELAAVTAQALRAAAALRFMQAGASTGKDGDDILDARAAMGRQRVLERQLAAIEAEINSIDAASVAVTPYTTGYSSSSGSSGRSGGGGSGHSGGSSSSSTEDKKLTALQDRVKLLKSELSLMKERGDSEEDQIAKIREIQDALKKEYQYLESIKGDQTTINNLYQEWYSYANQISDLEKQAADEAQKHADAIQAAVEAQKALDNILKNRSVRVYNASTGQWEWQADPAAVASAQSELDNAIASTGYTKDAWALLYSMLSSIGAIKDNWLNSGPGAVSNAFGGNSYGNTYNFGSIRLSEAQAQSMTVAEFARLANSLPAFNNSP